MAKATKQVKKANSRSPLCKSGCEFRLGCMRKTMLRIFDRLTPKYDPSPRRRAEVVENLAKRPTVSHEQWHRRYAAPNGISLEFVQWFRDTCSRRFEYDLSAALPNDDLVKDLGMFEATWGDVDWDIFEDFEDKFGKKCPPKDQKPIQTFGELLQYFWSQSR